jgi:hypothetical protein
MSYDPIHAASVEFALILAHRGLRAAPPVTDSRPGILRRPSAIRARLERAMRLRRFGLR